MAFIDTIKARAAASKKTIVLPESEDIRTYKAAEVDRNIGTLISFVMDDPAFIEAHRKQGVNEEIFLIRCGDYAAKEVFKAYSGQ